MNEGAKTGFFWLAAVAMLVVALFVSRAPEPEKETIVGQPLFPTFTDPLAASSLRIVTFNEEQSEIATFEVAKDEQTGVWSLPSRNNYPADAAEQMKDAANALVGVKVLDIQSETPEDHAKLGVLEPNVESLEAGDEGVGRLVTLKGQGNTTLASIIIGNPVKGSEGKRYVRIRGQDPVYVVNMDDKPLSSRFEDWIEKDLLQLSSIDIESVDIQNYDASLELGNQLALERHYDAKLAIDGGNAWQLQSLFLYDAQGEKKESALSDGEKLAVSKLNSLKNALDDLKIVDVAAKPKGMSENLKADKELVSDQQAVLSLAQRGFFPVSSEGDILAANGEMTVTLKDGVQYVLRFGNVKGLEEAGKTAEQTAAETAAQEKPQAAGANRYLLVTTRVDESKFPAPELAAIPKTIEELEAMEAAEAAKTAPAAAPGEQSPAPESAEPSEPAAKTEPSQSPEGGPAAEAGTSTEAPANAEPASAEAMKPQSAEDASAPATESAEPTDAPESPAESTDAAAASGDAPAEGVTEQSGAGEASGSGQGQAPEAAEPQQDAAAETEPTDTEPAETKPADTNPAEATAADTEAAPAAPASTEPATAKPADGSKPEDGAKPEDKEETAEEKQERLEAAQEKITKENQRKMDERKDQLEAARRKVRELNGRFAEWYYVIPEATYRNLRLSRDELIEKASASTPADAAADAPAFDIQGLPGGLPGLPGQAQ